MGQKAWSVGKLLNGFKEETSAICSYAQRHALPIVTEDMIGRCLDKIGMDVDRDYVKHFVMTGYERMPVACMMQEL